MPLGKRHLAVVARSGAGFVNSAINALPFELHIPGYQFCGPGTRLAKRLARGDRGINPLDAACREHDIAYSLSGEIADRHVADRALGERARERIAARDSTLGERAAAAAVWTAMKAKTKLGMGMASRGGRKSGKKRTTTGKRRKRVLPVAKRGGFLPLLPILGALGSLGSLIGGAAGMAKTVNARSAARRQLEELQRHDRAMEDRSGRGLYLAPYKRGSGATRRRRVKKKVRASRR